MKKQSYEFTAEEVSRIKNGLEYSRYESDTKDKFEKRENREINKLLKKL